MLSSPRNFGHDSQWDLKMFEVRFIFFYKKKNNIVGFKAGVYADILNCFSLRAEL